MASAVIPMAKEESFKTRPLTKKKKKKKSATLKCPAEVFCCVCGGEGTASEPVVVRCECSEAAHAKCLPERCIVCVEVRELGDAGVRAERLGDVAEAHSLYGRALLKLPERCGVSKRAVLAFAFVRTHPTRPCSRRRCADRWCGRSNPPSKATVAAFENAADRAFEFCPLLLDEDLDLVARICGFVARHHPVPRRALAAAVFAAAHLSCESLERASALVDVADVFASDPTVFLGDDWDTLDFRERRWAQDQTIAALEKAVDAASSLFFCEDLEESSFEPREAIAAKNKKKNKGRTTTMDHNNNMSRFGGGQHRKKRAVLAHALRGLGYARGARGDFDAAKIALSSAADVVKACEAKERWPVDFLSPVELQETIEAALRNHEARAIQQSKFLKKTSKEPRFQVGDLVQVRSPCCCGSYYHKGVVGMLWPSTKETKPYHVVLDDGRDVFPRTDDDGFVRKHRPMTYRFQRGDKVEAHVDGGYQRGTIIQLNYVRADDLEAQAVFPYQIHLDDDPVDVHVYAPDDDDLFVRGEKQTPPLITPSNLFLADLDDLLALWKQNNTKPLSLLGLDNNNNYTEDRNNIDNKDTQATPPIPARRRRRIIADEQ